MIMIMCTIPLTRGSELLGRAWCFGSKVLVPTSLVGNFECLYDHELLVPLFRTSPSPYAPE